MFIYMQKSTSSLTSFLRYCKDIVNLLFWQLWECLTIPIKIIVSICSKLSCLSACKKPSSSLTSFLRYCKKIANLLFWIIQACLATFILHIFLELFFYCKDIVNLFWILWTCLAMHTQSDNINLLKTFVFIFRRKKSTSSLMLY